MKRYARIYVKFAMQYIKTIVEYKQDFLYGILGFLFVQASSIIFISLIFNNISALGDWSYYEILFIYGFSQIPRGIDHILTDYLWLFSSYSIVKGEFDRYLLRPLNPLFQVIAERFQLEGLGELIVGIILVSTGFTKLNLEFKASYIPIFLIAVIASSFIYTAIKLAAASIAFWTKTSFRHLQLSYEFSNFAKYPTTIYPKPIRILISFIIPFAFTGYFPAIYFLGKGEFLNTIGITIIVAIVAMSVAYRIWKKGTESYESAGS